MENDKFNNPTLKDDLKLLKMTISYLRKKLKNREYQKNNREKCNATKRAYYKNNKHTYNAKKRKYYAENEEIFKKIRKNNIEYTKTYSKTYYEKNKKSLNDKQNTYHKNRRKADPLFRLIQSYRSRLRHFISLKINNTKKLLGCSPQEFKMYLASKFTNDMNWSNYGKKGWHIDHIIPLSLAKNNEEFKKLCHYTNCQPLWWHENLSKGNKII